MVNTILREADLFVRTVFGLILQSTLKLEKSVADSVTFYANVRINNHIKKKAEAVSGIYLYRFQKDAIANALDYLVDPLDAEDKQKFNFQLDILKSRDAKTKRN